MIRWLMWRLDDLLAPPIEVDLAREGNYSKEWLRQHPKIARRAGYIVIDGKVLL